MRVNKERTSAIFLTFSQDNGITRDKRSVTILDATKTEIELAIKSIYDEELQRRNTPLKHFVKLTVQIVDTKDKQKKDEFSYRLFRTDVNAIEKIIQYIDSD